MPKSNHQEVFVIRTSGIEWSRCYHLADYSPATSEKFNAACTTVQKCAKESNTKEQRQLVELK
jgi:hypothetical protein